MADGRRSNDLAAKALDGAAPASVCFRLSPRYKLMEPSERLDFSVVDTETTGLFPEKHDRIIEIAVVRADSVGRVLDHYTTLVNPSRDLGPVHIHGISAGEVKDAPSFAEIAGDVLSRLEGAVFTGYYPHFDFRFLACEMRRLGHKVPPTGLLCVNELARDIAPDLPGRKLEACCRHFGIELSAAHAAQADAVATTELLRACFRRTALSLPALIGHLNLRPFPCVNSIWPGLRPSGKSYTRETAAMRNRNEANYIARLVASLPPVAGADRSLNPYYAALDRILEDRIVTAEEAASLFSIARELGVSQSQAEDAHRKYIRQLVIAGLDGGAITTREEQDIRAVARILSIPDIEFEQILRTGVPTAVPGRAGPAAEVSIVNSLRGVSVCFTGELASRINGGLATREFAEACANEKGMVVRGAVTKGLDVLVAADPNSMSGKAKAARRYNIRIVAEPVFWYWMGVHAE